MELKDYGKHPSIFQIADLARQNDRYRTTLWTGEHVQVTLMSIPSGGGDVGLEIHDNEDQILFIVEGTGYVEMGYEKDNLTIQQEAHEGAMVIVPVNTWHNIKNAGDTTMKLFSIYSPVKHPFNTQQETK
ncbi:cupin domain-containing protein [Erysipelothrix tonsillarum]|uniref:cupin domain-containing protein n=1 Tax=Erysipelothrix tonsillarum TaxID=38402 RepID=UPI00036294A6|nr:cupin domain-containing protein [Erysipelothrix tonsillarum]